jgi:hypothetical protein
MWAATKLDIGRFIYGAGVMPPLVHFYHSGEAHVAQVAEVKL